MKVKCKLEVQDKYTDEIYKVNKVYELSKERAEEVVKAFNGKYFEFVEETKEEVVEEKPKRVRKSTKK